MSGMRNVVGSSRGPKSWDALEDEEYLTRTNISLSEAAGKRRRRGNRGSRSWTQTSNRDADQNAAAAGSQPSERPASSSTSAPEATSVPPVAAPKPATRPPPLSFSWASQLSRPTLAALILLIITFFHLVGLYTFTRGFLLTRLSIPAVSPAYTPENGPPIPPTHSKAVIIVIDALRTDFISPNHPSPPSPNHHGVLTLPAELTARHPHHSLLFNTFADPPTATMQRIKGITTGSLPTFVDIGANFASTAIEEDSLISQLVSANKSVVFMGDDTWENLFPDTFTHSHPFDSFNVEDLHTVDNGVIDHLFPYLHPSNSSKWDVLIGHFLGVDHVGHRVGPGAPTMREKLQQMDGVLRRVVDLLDDDALLVVLGDHGMDDKGNHGGDSEQEVAAALWMYSKGPALTTSNLPSVANALPRYTYPHTSTPIRHANQIDIVPTLSLLLGIPIPFNNLGSIIPDCFLGSLVQLEAAMRANVDQISRYIAEYGDGQIAAGLAGVAQARLGAVEKSGGSSSSLLASYHAHRAYANSALSLLRGLWAQFSITLITLGLLILGLNIPVLLLLYTGIRNQGPAWNQVAIRFVDSAVLVTSTVAGAVAGIVGVYLAITNTWNTALVFHSGAIGGVLAAEALFAHTFFTSLRLPSLSSITLKRAIGPILLILHAVSFASNSFIMWEDHMVVYLINTITAIYLLKSLTHPTADMRLKVIALSVAFGVATRLLGSITVCREEQQPFCRVTFYSGSTPVAASWVLLLLIPVALQLPRAIGLTLSQSKSTGGPVPTFLGKLWRGILTLNSLQWLLEYTSSSDFFTGTGHYIVKIVRTWAARFSYLGTMVVLPYYWFTSGLCITIERGTEQDGSQKPVTVFGFANAFGSTYLLFLLIPFGLFHLVSPPMAQLALSVLLCAIIAHLENIDTQRDSILMTTQFSQSGAPGGFEPTAGSALVRPSFTDIAPLALLGFIGFFSTGHQAVLTTIQWKAAFVGFETLIYPFAPLLVILNTWGPFLLTAMAVPLLAIWNVSPRPQGQIPILAHAMQLAIGFIIYHTTLTFASALFAAWLRRHLMVWKVFAPRFMLSAATLVLIDLAIIVAVTVGLRVTSWKVWRTFKCESI